MGRRHLRSGDDDPRRRTREVVTQIPLPPNGDVGLDGRPYPAGVVCCAVWTRDGTRLLIGTGGYLPGTLVDGAPQDPGEIAVVDTSTWKVVDHVSLDRVPEVMTLDRDGRWLAVSSANSQEVVILDGDTLQERHRVALSVDDSLWAMAFSPDGRLLAGGGEARKVHVIDTDTWEAREAVPVRDAELIQIGWLPDNRTVLATSEDGAVLLFDTDRALVRGAALPASVDHEPGYARLVPEPDDEIVAFNDQWVGLRYPMEPSVWLRDACAIAGRDLTPRGVGPVPAGPGVGTDLHRPGVARLVDAPLLVVSGSSGAGKSSLVRAGLVPALAGGALPGSAAWQAAVVNPGRRPVDALAALTGERAPKAGPACRRPVRGTLGNGRGLRRADRLPRHRPRADRRRDRRAVRGCPARRPRRAAGRARGLRRAGRGGTGARPTPHRGGAPRRRARACGVGRADGRDRTARRRRRRRGRSAGGAAAAVDGAGRHLGAPQGRPPHPGRLSGGGRRRRRARPLGGGGLPRLTDEERESARRLLVRLADTDDGGALVRRPLPLSELDMQDGTRRTVVDAFVARRLLAVDGVVLDVAHEALLTSWPRLARWLEDDAAGRAVRRHLAPAAQEWQQHGEPGDELFRGARLSAALDWAADALDDLTPLERRFLDASKERADAELVEARDRLRREAVARRRTRRLARGAGGRARRRARRRRPGGARATRGRAGHDRAPSVRPRSPMRTGSRHCPAPRSRWI